MSRPAYLDRDGLARELSLKPGTVDQLVKRGLLPAPVMIGEALRWRWEDVDGWITRTRAAGSDRYDGAADPYMAGVQRAAPATPLRRAANEPNG